MGWVDALGWFGSALLVFSLLQARILRLRLLNTVACAILVVFNAVIEVWPMVAMNVVLAAINLFFIARMLREKGDERAYTVLKQKRPERKTPSQRNKIKRRKEAERLAKHEKRMTDRQKRGVLLAPLVS